MEYILTLLLILLLSGNTVSAEFNSEVLKSLDSYVYDGAGVLSGEQEESINLQIDSIREQTTAEVLVVLISSTDGEDISSLGVRIGQEVWVGKADVDNGVVILVAVEDREWNISTGYGVEGILPDIRTKRIGEANFPEYFRAGNYAGWIAGAVNDIGLFLEQDPEVISKYEARAQDDLVPVGLFIWMIFLFFGGFLYKKNEKQQTRLMKYGGIVLVTSALLYLLLPVLMLIINFVFHSLVAYLYDKVEWESWSWDWWWSGWGSNSSWSWWSGKSRGGFGWGWFGGWGSKWKW